LIVVRGRPTNGKAILVRADRPRFCRKNQEQPEFCQDRGRRDYGSSAGLHPDGANARGRGVRNLVIAATGRSNRFTKALACFPAGSEPNWEKLMFRSCATGIVTAACLLGQGCGPTTDLPQDNNNTGFAQVDTSDAAARRFLAGSWTWLGAQTDYGRMNLTLTFDSAGQPVSVRGAVVAEDQNSRFSYPNSQYANDLPAPARVSANGDTSDVQFHIDNLSNFNFVKVSVLISYSFSPIAGVGGEVFDSDSYDLIDGIINSDASSIRFTVRGRSGNVVWNRE